MSHRKLQAEWSPEFKKWLDEYVKEMKRFVADPSVPPRIEPFGERKSG